MAELNAAEMQLREQGNGIVIVIRPSLFLHSVAFTVTRQATVQFFIVIFSFLLYMKSISFLGVEVKSGERSV